MLRRCGFDGRVTIVDEEPDSPYDRPNLSKDYLAGNAPEEWIPLRPDGLLRRARHRRRPRPRDGASTSNAQDARGGRARRRSRTTRCSSRPAPSRSSSDCPATQAPHVHYLRSLADSRSIIAAAGTAKRAVVIGASFIGLEVGGVAAHARARGARRRAGSGPARARARHARSATSSARCTRRRASSFHLGRKPAAHRGGRRRARRRHAARAPISSSSASACGRASRSPSRRVSRWTAASSSTSTSRRARRASTPRATSRAGPIRTRASAFASSTGSSRSGRGRRRRGTSSARGERFDYVPFFWSAHYDVSINYVGHAEKWDDVDVDGDAATRDVAVRFERDGKAARARDDLPRRGESGVRDRAGARGGGTRAGERIPMTE